MGVSLKCKTCKKNLIFKGGSLDKERKIFCPQGHENLIRKKKNGKFEVN